MKFGPMMDDPLAIYHGNVTGRLELARGGDRIARMLLIRYTVHKHFDARGNSYTFGQQTMDSTADFSRAANLGFSLDFLGLLASQVGVRRTTRMDSLEARVHFQI